MKGSGKLSSEREYKDGMFRALFNTPEKALRLYSDITGKSYPDLMKVSA